jgi:hypothetical protein
MKKDFGVQSLALAIFVLWSLGLIFIPQARYSGSELYGGLVFVYLFLHAVIFAFTLVLLFKNIKALSSKKVKASARWYGLLYVYVLAALAVSTFLITRVLFS